MTPKGLTSHTSLMLMARSIFCLMVSLLVMILAICSPAMLNDFVGELVVIQLSWQAFDTAANGVNLYPGITSSQWISSAITLTPCFRQISFMRLSSSGVHTRPAGLWGLQSKNTFVFSSAASLSKSSKSISYELPLRTSAFSAVVQPLLRMEEKKQL